MFYVNYTMRSYTTKGAVHEGWARYEEENEMYADLEVQGITEDNPDVLHLDFFHTVDVDGKTYVDNTWM